MVPGDRRESDRGRLLSARRQREFTAATKGEVKVFIAKGRNGRNRESGRNGWVTSLIVAARGGVARAGWGGWWNTARRRGRRRAARGGGVPRGPALAPARRAG